MISKVHDPSATMLLIDARDYFVEYYDRGSALNSMEAMQDANEGGILDARGRHGKLGTSWNVASMHQRSVNHVMICSPDSVASVL